jgi:vancomycin resistance protein YoaR
MFLLILLLIIPIYLLTKYKKKRDWFMNTNNTKFHLILSNHLTILAISIIAAITLVTLLLSTITILNSSKVFSGVYVGKMPIEKATKETAYSTLQHVYSDKQQNSTLHISAGQKNFEKKYSDLLVTYDVKQAVEKAYVIGRNGNYINRMYDIVNTKFNNKTISISIDIDPKSVEALVNSIYNGVFVETKQHSLNITNDNLCIKSGHNGTTIDKKDTISKITQSIKNDKNEPIDINLITIPPAPLDLEENYKKVFVQVKDASIKTSDNGIHTVAPHITGKDIDKTSLSNIIKEIENKPDSEFNLPIKSINPQITTNQIYDQILSDVISSSTTYFNRDSTNNANRGSNIELASAKINGTILNPGETFSFNKVVGQRTPEKGYKPAKTYADGKMVTDYGGGICQVSSTLNRAVLYADLSIVERHNHMFQIGYIPLGLDAAVSYGDCDYKFKNSSKWPIKITCYVSSDDSIVFDIISKNDNTNKKVDITTKTIAQIPFSEKVIDDSTLEKGTSYISEKGLLGYVVETYKTVTENNTVVKSGLTYTSNYNPYSQVIRKSTQ